MKNHYCEDSLCLARVANKGDLCEECEVDQHISNGNISEEMGLKEAMAHLDNLMSDSE